MTYRKHTTPVAPMEYHPEALAWEMGYGAFLLGHHTSANWYQSSAMTAWVAGWLAAFKATLAGAVAGDAFDSRAIFVLNRFHVRFVQAQLR